MGYRREWRLEFERAEVFYRTQCEGDPFELWDLVAMPERRAEREVGHALVLLYAEQRELVDRYLERAIAIAERALAEDKCRSAPCRAAWPYNEGHLYRALAYARGLADGRIELDLLRRAADGVGRYCDAVRMHHEDDVVDELDLGALRITLIAGDRAWAAARLASDRRHREPAIAHERALLERLASGAIGDVEKPLRGLFEEARNPRTFYPILHEPVLHRFELGALVDRYLDSPDGGLDWRRVVAAVRA